MGMRKISLLFVLLFMAIPFKAFSTSPQAQSCSQAQLDPKRVSWLQLSYKIRKVSVEVRLASLPAAEVEAALIKSPQGLSIEVESPVSNKITFRKTVKSLFKSVKTINHVWFKPDDAAALGRMRLRRGNDDFKKVYRFTKQGVFRHRREPKNRRESSKQPKDWTDVKDMFYNYNLDRLGCPSVTERLILIYIVSAAKISNTMQPISFCVFGKRQLFRVQFKPAGFHSLNVDFVEKKQQEEIRRQGEVQALKIVLETRPLASDLDKVENFSFFGFQKNIAIFIDPASNLPVQLSGDYPSFGNVTIKLREAYMR